MSLVKHNGNSATRRTAGAGLVTANLPIIARQLGQLLGAYVKQASSSGGQKSTQSRSDRRRDSQRASRNNEAKWSTYGGSGPQRSISYSRISPGQRVAMKGVYPCNNQTAGLFNSRNLVGWDGGASGLFTFLNGQQSNILKAWNFFRVRKLVITLTPTGGTNAGGYMAVGFTDRLTYPAPTGLAEITSYCNVYKVGSIWNPLTIEYNCPNFKEEFCLNEPGRDLEHRFMGDVRYHSSNNLVTNSPIFVLEFSVDLDLW